MTKYIGITGIIYEECAVWRIATKLNGSLRCLHTGVQTPIPLGSFTRPKKPLKKVDGASTWICD